MNRKVMSLLTALLLCLNFSTVWAFAAEGTPDAGAPPVVDTGTPLKARTRMDEGPVAAVEVAGEETAYYPTVKEAFEAANNSQKAVVRLLKDAELKEAVIITSDVTLEAEGSTLSGPGGRVAPGINPEPVMFALFEGGTFTLQSGTIDSTALSIVNIRGGTFNMTGGTIKSTNDSYHVLYIVDSTADASDSKKTTSTANLSGGTINAPGKEILISGEGSSATFSGCDMAVRMIRVLQGATLDITGGDITAKGNTALSVASPNGEKTTLKVSGGTITIDSPSTSPTLGVRCLQVQWNADVQLSGGTFDNKRDHNTYTRDSTIVIEAVDNKKLNNLLADGYGYFQNDVLLNKSDVESLDKLAGTVRIAEIPLIFTVQPTTGLGVPYGSDDSLTATAVCDAGEVTYQWYCRPTPKEGEEGQGFQPIQGAVSDTLSLKEVGPGEYEYYCVASCAGYGKMSDIAAVTVGKADPYVTGIPAASIIYGSTIGDIPLTGCAAQHSAADATPIPGTFTWKEPNIVPGVADSEFTNYVMVFAPDDTDHYNPLETLVTVTVEKATPYLAALPAATATAGEPLGNATLVGGAAQYSITNTTPVPGSFAWKDPATVPALADSDKTAYAVVFTPTDTENYEKVELAVIPTVVEKPKEVKRYDLTEVPDGLAGKFATVEELKTVLKQKVTAALAEVGDQIAIYDVRLQYQDTDGIWKDVDPNSFPAGGVTAVLPYPDGTNGTDYIFTVQHMISHGPDAGTVEELRCTAVKQGLECRFTSLSPVAIGWRIKDDPKPDDPKPPQPDDPKPDGPNSGGTSDPGNDEYDFWQGVRQKIKAAKPGDTIKANAGSYDKMSWTVMEALKKSDCVTLVIRWNGGADIVIPAEKALDEALRIYYPLAYLAGYDFGIITDPGKQNPETGGIWEIDAPITAQAPLTSAGTPEITDARRGLAETPELAEQGVEKAIPGVYEPTANATPAESPVQSGERGSFSVAAVFLLAALLGLIWVWRKKGNESHGESVQNSQ